MWTREKKHHILIFLNIMWDEIVLYVTYSVKKAFYSICRNYTTIYIHIMIVTSIWWKVSDTLSKCRVSDMDIWFISKSPCNIVYKFFVLRNGYRFVSTQNKYVRLFLTSQTLLQWESCALYHHFFSSSSCAPGYCFCLNQYLLVCLSDIVYLLNWKYPELMTDSHATTVRD